MTGTQAEAPRLSPQDLARLLAWLDVDLVRGADGRVTLKLR